jgi:hypothetical protein
MLLLRAGLAGSYGSVSEQKINPIRVKTVDFRRIALGRSRYSEARQPSHELRDLYSWPLPARTAYLRP